MALHIAKLPRYPGIISTTQYSYGDDQDGSNNVRSYPLDYTFSGAYRWQFGGLGYQTTQGFWWSITPVTNTHSNRLHIWSSNVKISAQITKADGSSLRYKCLNEAYSL